MKFNSKPLFRLIIILKTFRLIVKVFSRTLNDVFFYYVAHILIYYLITPNGQYKLRYNAVYTMLGVVL